MAVMAALPRPGLEAQRKSHYASLASALVEQLTEILGRKLVADIAGVKDLFAPLTAGLEAVLRIAMLKLACVLLSTLRERCWNMIPFR